MTISEWFTIIVASMTILSSFGLTIKWVVKHYLRELKPNGGMTVKDQISEIHRSLENQRIDSENARDRQERKLDELYKILIEHIAKNNL